MEPDYIKQKALIRILDDDEALGAALKLYLELDGWQVAAYTSARRFFAEDRPSVPGCLVRSVMRAAGDSVMKAEGKVSDEAAVALVERLTERELEVARLVAQGLVSRIVGERLGISPRTAELHRSHAMKKLSAASPEHLKNILKSAGAI